MSGERAELDFAEDRGEIATDEIREFLEADRFGAMADPKFKEALRQTLWDFLHRPKDRTGSDRTDIDCTGGERTGSDRTRS